MSYDAILFDMDGVLLTGYHTDRDIYRQATAATLADFGHEGVEEPPAGLVNPDSVEDIESTCTELGLPAASVWACRERASTTLENESIVAGDRLTPPDISALDGLAEEYDLGIVSNNRQGTARFVTDHFDFPMDVVRARFPTLEEYATLKPHPEFIEWAMDRLGTTDALYVGDRRTDVLAAHRAGLDAALLSRSGKPPDGEGEPRYHIESLSDIADRIEA